MKKKISALNENEYPLEPINLEPITLNNHKLVDDFNDGLTAGLLTGLFIGAIIIAIISNLIYNNKYVVYIDDNGTLQQIEYVEYIEDTELNTITVKSKDGNIYSNIKNYKIINGKS